MPVEARRSVDPEIDLAPAARRPRSAYKERLETLLTAVAEGEVSPAHAARELSDLPFTDLGFVLWAGRKSASTPWATGPGA